MFVVWYFKTRHKKCCGVLSNNNLSSICIRDIRRSSSLGSYIFVAFFIAMVGRGYACFVNVRNKIEWWGTQA